MGMERKCKINFCPRKHTLWHLYRRVTVNVTQLPLWWGMGQKWEKEIDVFENEYSHLSKFGPNLLHIFFKFLVLWVLKWKCLDHPSKCFQYLQWFPIKKYNIRWEGTYWAEKERRTYFQIFDGPFTLLWNPYSFEEGISMSMQNLCRMTPEKKKGFA